MHQSVDQAEGESACLAASEGWLSDLQEILTRNPITLNHQNLLNSWTPLMCSLAHGHEHVVTYLLSRGANVTKCSLWQLNAMHLSSHEFDNEAAEHIMELLVAAGGDVNIVANAGETL